MSDESSNPIKGSQCNIEQENLPLLRYCSVLFGSRSGFERDYFNSAVWFVL